MGGLRIGNDPGYDAYLDDPNDYTTGFGYGESSDADTPATDEPDINDLEIEQLVNDGVVPEGLAKEGLVRGAMVKDGPGRAPVTDEDEEA